MSWDVFALDLPSGIKSIDEIPEGWSPAPLAKRTDIIARICALYPEASFDDGLSWSSLRLSGVGIEFNLGEDEEVECLGKHVPAATRRRRLSRVSSVGNARIRHQLGERTIRL